MIFVIHLIRKDWLWPFEPKDQGYKALWAGIFKSILRTFPGR